MRERRALITLAAIILLAAACEARAESWSTYVNDRFGATADYPARFSVLAEPPANNDGQRFFTADRRASLAVFGFFNTEDETPEQIMESRKNAGIRYTLAAAGRGAFTLSGRRGDRIVYERCLRSRHKDIYVCVDLEYPAEELAAYDPIVTRVANSLRAGKPW
ncbi:hypothetical protein [Enterovirga sp.]|uniref:hypothetical protein n=1 Tax=Enterovirga sp. TaxID=2026350 RepID=UPI002BC492AE|nr:hypothetical protein [Enterovirga sp.]HMO29572.1 hypothetical protein [Enterovirga sp.]